MNRSTRRAAIGALLVTAGMSAGAIGAGLVGSASAQTTSSTSAAATTPSSGSSSGSSTPAPPAGGFDPTKGGHVGANGVKEVLLTGDTATKATAAANAAVPGATIQRVETDAEGATYEAHMTKSDGTQVTVKMDANYKVTGIETGGPGNGAPPAGAPAGAPAPANGTAPAAPAA